VVTAIVRLVAPGGTVSCFACRNSPCMAADVLLNVTSIAWVGLVILIEISADGVTHRANS
jgi:hypothetical protein